MLKNILIICIFVITALAQAEKHFGDQAAKPDIAPLAPTTEHKKTTLEILKTLEKRHYIDITINDALSRDLLDHFIDTLDKNRQVFTQGDVEHYIKQYGNTLDDLIIRGDVSPAFVMYNQYREKRRELIQQQLNNLDKKIRGFTYKTDDSLVLDRSESPWPKNHQGIQAIWQQQLISESLTLHLEETPIQEIIDTINRRYSNQRKRLDKVSADDVFALYINAFAELYDPHTSYMSPESSKNFDIAMSLKLEGIGAVLSNKDEYTEIVRLIHGGPAQKQGQLKPSDRIIAVAQENEEPVDIVGWRLDEVVQIIRGKKGTKVTLTVQPSDAKKTASEKRITITRDEVKLEDQAIQYDMLHTTDDQGNKRAIGIINIPTFYIDFAALRKQDPNYKSTTRDAAKAINTLVGQGAEGLVIDLRNNGGGSLREANELTGLFIPQGPTVQIRSSNKRVYQEGKPRKTPYYQGPVVVLVNRLSASASEIFAGALQDYKRAPIIGTQTFGKGTVQSLTELSNQGKLKVTESKFYRISGDSTQHRGVIPDITLPNMFDKEYVGESALEKALPWDTIGKTSHLIFDFAYSRQLPALIKQSQIRQKNDPDFVFYNAINQHNQSLKSLNRISLNKKIRQKEQNEDDNIRLAFYNQRQTSKKLDTFADLDEAIEHFEAKQEARNENGVDSIDLDDPFIKEAARVLMDANR